MGRTRRTVNPDIIDAPSVVAEEVPAALLEALEQWRDQLSVLQMQYEWAPRSWKNTRHQLNLGTPPPEQSALELAAYVVDQLRRYHQSWPSNSEPPERYRVRGELLTPDGKRWRSVQLKVSWAPDGSVTFVDADDLMTAERNATQIATQAYDHASQISMRCLDAVATATTKVVALMGTVEQIARGSAELAQRSADGFAKVLEVEAAMKADERRHAEDMARIDALQQLGMQVAAPLAKLFAAQFFGGPASNAAGSLCEQLRRICAEAGDRWPLLMSNLTEYEQRSFAELLAASSDERFLGIFRKLSDSWDETRLAAVIELVTGYLGEDLARRLGLFMMEAQRRANL